MKLRARDAAAYAYFMDFIEPTSKFFKDEERDRIIVDDGKEEFVFCNTNSDGSFGRLLVRFDAESPYLMFDVDMYETLDDLLCAACGDETYYRLREAVSRV